MQKSQAVGNNKTTGKQRAMAIYLLKIGDTTGGNIIARKNDCQWLGKIE